MCDIYILPLHNVSPVLAVVFSFWFSLDYLSSSTRYFVLCLKTDPNLGRITVVSITQHR